MKGRVAQFFAALVLLTASLLYVRSRFLVVELSYALSEKQEHRSKLEQEKRALTLEFATLRAPTRIERVANRSLGLKRSPKENLVVVMKGDRP